MWTSCGECRFSRFPETPLPRLSQKVWKEWTWCSIPETFQRDPDLGNALSERWILVHHRDGALERMDDGGMIAAAESRSDLDQLHSEQFAHQVHRDLPRHCQILRARLGAEPLVGDVPLLRHRLLDREAVERRTARCFARERFELVAQGLARHLDRDLAVLERRVGEQFDDRPFEFPNARS